MVVTSNGSLWFSDVLFATASQQLIICSCEIPVNRINMVRELILP